MHKSDYREFRQIVSAHYLTFGRHELPWRTPEPDGSFDPYKILVSEIMLQQTQAPRVIPKFVTFMEIFPTIQRLEAAPLKDVLIAWQGLGYNRRAKFLWQAAKQIVEKWNGQFPHSIGELALLPGIGKNTAGAILAYAFNEPNVFIETNIRTVYIHHFFGDQANVADKDILELVQETLDYQSPRVWYWMLMDYGAYLKQTVGNVSRASKTYSKQPKFVGSLRQLRGHVLRLLANGPVDQKTLLKQLADARAEMVLRTLESEGMIRYDGRTYELP